VEGGPCILVGDAVDRSDDAILISGAVAGQD